jgi:biopolymer transport protein ExbD
MIEYKMIRMYRGVGTSNFFSLNFKHAIIPFLSLLLAIILILFGLLSPFGHGGPYIKGFDFKNSKIFDDSCKVLISIDKNKQIYINSSLLMRLDIFPEVFENECEDVESFDKNGRPLVALHIDTETSWGFIVKVLRMLKNSDVNTVWLINKNITYTYGYFFFETKKVNDIWISKKEI